MSQVPAIPRTRPLALAWLREAEWLTGERVRAYGQLFALVTVGVVIARFAGVFASDYVEFWAAGHLVLAGRAADAYDLAREFATIRLVLPNAQPEPFFYPPVFLLICTPFAILPYYWSMLAFVAASLLGYWQAMRVLLPRAGLVLLGFPGVALAVLSAQNGLISAALFGGALAVLGRAPAFAGVLFGCLCYKPQLGLLIPLALIATRQWRAFAAAAVTVLGLVALSAALFGLGAWRGFLADLPFARSLLDNPGIAPALWASTYRLMLQVGAGHRAAVLVQGGLTVGACITLVLACRRRPDAITGLLPAAALLATPYLFSYDLPLLAVPMAWIVLDARRRGFLPWEKAGLACVYLAPMLTLLVGNLHLTLGPPAMLLMAALVLRRVWRVPPVRSAALR